MDFADAASDSGDDQLAIIDLVPSQRLGADTNVTLLNGYTLTSATAEGPEEHIYDTSITYNSGADIYDGIQCFGNSSNIQIIQNGARVVNDFWNEPKMKTAVEDTVSSTTHRFLIKSYCWCRHRWSSHDRYAARRRNDLYRVLYWWWY
jgi:hypothetical protein